MDKFIPATHDVVFKALFARNTDILKAFLRDVLDLPLSEEDKVLVLNPEIVPLVVDGKLCRLDIHVETDKRKFNIEMQARRQGFSPERILFYWSKMYASDVRESAVYETLDRTFSVNVLSFSFLESEEYHTSFSIRDDREHKQLTDKLSIHLFELPKVPKELKANDDRQMWMRLIMADTEEVLAMIKDTTTNPEIKKGAEKILDVNADIALREQIWARDKALYDYWNDMNVARREGVEQGIQQGIEQGIDQGRENRDNELTEKWRKQGKSEEEIAQLLGK